MLNLDLHRLPEGLRLGTSSFGNDDWRGVFYPADARPRDYLRFYAERLGTVEIDATWYASPSAKLVDGWAQKVPDSFRIAAKVPKRITHEAYLESCDTEWTAFVRTMDRLGEKRGPLLFQFPYIAKRVDADEYRTGDDFRRRLARFLPGASGAGRLAVEVRNRTWLAPPLFDLLREHGVALVLSAYYTMPGVKEYEPILDDLSTADFGYVRFLGNHRAMDKKVREAREAGDRERDWDSLLVDRSAETRAWIGLLRTMRKSGSDIFAYFNNHYAGFAPGSIDLFARMWE